MKPDAATVPRLFFALIPFSALVIAAPQCVFAQPIPAPGAHADASADAAGGPSDSDTDNDPVTASATATSSGDDFAEAMAEATVGGAARSLSTSGGASGQAIPSQADGNAQWISNLVATGTDPGNPIDIDLVTAVDGLLDYLNNNSGASADAIRSSVNLTLTVYGQSAATTVFDGGASLATVTNSTPPQLVRTGDWAASSRDGDFSSDGCSAFSCTYDVNLATTFQDVALVEFGEPFALQFKLGTAASTFAGREVEALADFFNTGNVTVATDTPGITFQVIPEPTSFMLLAAAVGLCYLRFSGESGCAESICR